MNVPGDRRLPEQQPGVRDHRMPCLPMAGDGAADIAECRQTHHRRRPECPRRRRRRAACPREFRASLESWSSAEGRSGPFPCWHPVPEDRCTIPSGNRHGRRHPSKRPSEERPTGTLRHRCRDGVTVAIGRGGLCLKGFTAEARRPIAARSVCPLSDRTQKRVRVLFHHDRRSRARTFA
jgi:hypothetical protein